MDKDFNNDFLFSKESSSQKPKQEVMQKYREEKEKLKLNKEKESKAAMIQGYLKSHLERIRLRKQISKDFQNKMNDLEKLSSIVWDKKQQILQLPAKNLVPFIRQFAIVLSLQKSTKMRLQPNSQKGFIDRSVERTKESVELAFQLCKWLQKSMNPQSEQPQPQQQQFLIQLLFQPGSPNKLNMSSSFVILMRAVLEYIDLGFDNKSGSFMNFISSLWTQKCSTLSIEQQSQFEQLIPWLEHSHWVNKSRSRCILEIIRKWVHSRLELHLPFEQISSEKKGQVVQGLKFSVLLFNSFIQTNRTIDTAINLQYDFVNHIFSLPTINKYCFKYEIMDSVHYKNLFSSYYFSKKVDMDQKEAEEHKKDQEGYLINEAAKSEKKMFIFANTFELLHQRLVPKLNAFELYPVLQVLESTACHLSRKALDTENASIDDYIMTIILRNQLVYMLDFKTTSKIFGHVFGESVNKKHSIFEDFFNPQAAISLTRIYSTILMVSRHSPKVFNTVILGIAFNEPVLYKLWKFIDFYCGVESLLVKNVRDFDQYNSFVHSLALFSLAFTRNLWVSSFEDFLKNQYFERQDVRAMVRLLRELIINLIMEQTVTKKSSHLDDFVLYSASVLLRLLHEYFAIKDYLDPSCWDITQVKWKEILESQFFPPEIKRIIQLMPECIPFDVRATLFQQMIKNDVAKNEHVQKTYVKIRRALLFEDGYRAFSKVGNLKNVVGVVFLNELGMQEEGQDAGGLFKEFLTNLSQVVFNPNYGLFLATEKEKELYPNPQSHMLFPKNDLNYFAYLGRILGKAMYEGITLEPKFADFFLRKLIGKQNSLNDLKSLDPDLYKQLIQLKTFEGNVEDLMLSFVVSDENELTGEVREVELFPGGTSVNVTNQNRFRYIYMMADFRLNKRIKPQSDAFVRGFHELIPLEWLRIFNEREMQMLISGKHQSIDVQDLKKYTKYMGGYSSWDSKIKMFWKVVETEFSDDDRSKLLKFVTSCQRQPLMGFAQMQPAFTISRMDCDRPDEKLPTSSTCFNILRLPPYSNAKILKERVLYAIHSNSGFELA